MEESKHLGHGSPGAEHRESPRPVRGFIHGLKNPPKFGTMKHLAVALLGEYVGTVLFLFFAYGGVMVGKSSLGGNPSTTGEYLIFLLFGATSFGASLAVNVWVFYRITGGLFNPAVTTAFILTGLMNPLKGALLFIVQLVGGITAAAIIDGLTPGPLKVDNALGPNVTVVQGLFMEMFLTAELIITIFMLAVEKHRATFLAPVGIGLAVFIGHIVGIYFTGAGLNPARSFGPAVVEGIFPHYHWIYCKLFQMMDYYTANPGQDDDGRAEVLATGGPSV
ncbi:aquaporin-like protein [Naematelia encephala]|uniref:Aquaporin-like protein n=1 Tax=Naematelia encephala TaxID=71784 RepID=A0A1Y2BID1_9TREE|nr:aquaporin-like protein [Naematelia encephala]